MVWMSSGKFMLVSQFVILISVFEEKSESFCDSYCVFLENKKHFFFIS
jgi:hypothetical protein